VHEACKRLVDNEHYGNMTIQAIYEEVGYRNAVSFIRVFKKVMGMTPSVYQKLSKD
jgi:AraC-like DNA-binding protein